MKFPEISFRQDTPATRDTSTPETKDPIEEVAWQGNWKAGERPVGYVSTTEKRSLLKKNYGFSLTTALKAELGEDYDSIAGEYMAAWKKASSNQPLNKEELAALLLGNSKIIRTMDVFERSNAPIKCPTDEAHRNALKEKLKEYQTRMAAKGEDDLGLAFRITALEFFLLSPSRGGGEIHPSELFQKINHEVNNPAAKRKFDDAIRIIRNYVENKGGDLFGGSGLNFEAAKK